MQGHLQFRFQLASTIAPQRFKDQWTLFDGGTLKFEYDVAFAALLVAGLSGAEAEKLVEDAEKHFEGLGYDHSRLTRTPWQKSEMGGGSAGGASGGGGSTGTSSSSELSPAASKAIDSGKGGLY